MEQLELKKNVAKLLSEKKTLSEIQDILKCEFSHSMTFLDLRLLASELEGIDWKQFDPVKEEITEEEEVELVGDGKTHIEISPVQRPGAMISGSVIFASGAKANWMLDQSGQLGLDKEVGQATEADLQGFKEELQKVIQQGGV